MEPKEAPAPNQQQGGRSSRRKPAAPQWVNPEWQDEKEKTSAGDEVIINGVCVMQTTDDYGRRSAEETVRVEPTPVNDRFDDDQSDVSSVSHEQDGQAEHSDAKEPGEGPGAEGQENEDGDKSAKQENEDERWDY